ncbi:hypothetical protein GGG16DRAFT_102921 [Schizophyllum commune]
MSDATNIGQSSNKRKRACDYCKAKRVICHPHPDGCPRCKEKGVHCTTTLKPRRLRTTKSKPSESPRAIDVQEGESSNTGSNNCTALALQERAPPRAHTPPLHLTACIDSEAIPGALVEDALDTLAAMMPEYSLFFPVRKYRTIMQNCGWDVRLLPPQERILISCFLAFASLVSVDPFYVGYDASGHKFPDTHLRWDKVNTEGMDAVDIREIGRRRRPISMRFYGEAVRQAHQDGVTSLASKENAISCFLLNMLDTIHDPQTLMPWASAAVWQLRTLYEQNATEDLWGVSPRTALELDRVQWRACLAASAAYCVSRGKGLPFSAYDETVIAGPDPRNIDDVLAKISEPDYPRHHAVIDSLNSIGARCIRLTREILENIVGVIALRRPLDELEVSRHVSAMEHSFTTVSRFRRFIQGLGEERELRMAMYSTSTAYTSLAVALYRTLRRRLSESAVLATSHAARLATLCRRSRTIAARSVVEAVADLRRLIAAHWIGWFQACGFQEWAEILLKDEHGEPLDENEVSEEDRVTTLLSLREMLHFSSFMGVERSHSVAVITAELDALRGSPSLPSTWFEQSPPTDGSSTGTPGSFLQSDSFSAADTATVFTDATVLNGDLAAATDNNTDVAQWWNTVPTDVDWTDVSSWMGLEGAEGRSSDSWAPVEGNGSPNEL